VYSLLSFLTRAADESAAAVAGAGAAAAMTRKSIGTNFGTADAVFGYFGIMRKTVLTYETSDSEGTSLRPKPRALPS
jgi:hypothetical protein